MNITLLFPPAADPSLPYGSLPLLGAILKRSGHQDILLRDLNLEAFDDLLQPENLQEAIDKCRFIYGKSTSRKAIYHPAIAEEVLKNINTAKNILRDQKSFYEPQKLLFAKHIFHLGCTLISSPYPNISFGKYSYSASSYNSFEEIAHAIHTDSGPLSTYFREISVPSILVHNPRVIGVCVPYFSQLIPAFMLADIIREHDPSIHITMGGPVITWGKQVLAKDPRFSRWLDSFFVGEADETFLELIEALEDHRSFDQIRNIVRYINGRTIDQFDPNYQFNLDLAPTPDFTMLPMHRYFAPKRIICMTLTRGCYYNKCTFCNYAFIKLAPYRMRCPQQIAEDISCITEGTGEDVFCFESDVILPRDLKRISEAIIERGVKIKWHGVARFERGMTQELFDLMRRSGCVRLYMGLESANKRILKAMEKGTTPERMTKILDMCYNAGISVEAGVFDKFPTETIEEAEETYQFIRAHRHVITRADIGSFRMLKGSPIAENPEKFGVTLLNNPQNRWYHLEFDDPTSYSLPSGPRSSARQLIQDLYPEVMFIDIPEDILYTAQNVTNVFGNFFNCANLVEQESMIDVSDRSMLTINPNIEILEVTLTNAGAVHFSYFREEETYMRSPFELSETKGFVTIDSRNSAIYLITPLDLFILLKVKQMSCTSIEAQYDVLQWYASDTKYSEEKLIMIECKQSLNSLLTKGLLNII